MREIAETSWSAVGRQYGVSDNAVRKWVRWYEAEAAVVRPSGRSRYHSVKRVQRPSSSNSSSKRLKKCSPSV